MFGTKSFPQKKMQIQLTHGRWLEPNLFPLVVRTQGSKHVWNQIFSTQKNADTINSWKVVIREQKAEKIFIHN